MKGKRVLSIFLCAALVFALLPVSALAAENIGAWRGDWETIGGLSDGFLHLAKGIAADSAGNVYAADPYSHCVRKMTAATGRWQDFSDERFGSSDYPWAVAVDRSDNVYVLNSINANGTNGVWKYAGGVWTDITHGASFGRPQGIAVDRNGNVYVANTDLHTIVKLPSGSSTWTTIGNASFDYGVTFNEPIGIATDQNNNVYVTDKDAANHGHVYRLLNGSGQWTTRYNANNPKGVAADPSGNIYVLEGTIIRMWPGSSITNDYYIIKANPAFSNPYGLAVGGDGRVYVTSQDGSFGLISEHQGWATQLEWSTQPGGGASGQSFASQPVLRLLDAAGNLMTGFSGDTVTISLNAANGATLSGTVTAMLQNGVATFSNLSVDKSGRYTLVATGSIASSDVTYFLTEGSPLTPANVSSSSAAFDVYTAPGITTESMPNGTVGTAYSQTLSATGDSPITWSLAGGGLPTGLTLTGNTISGTPTVEGTFNFTVKATNAAGSDTQNFSIVISPATPPGTAPSITTESMPNGIVGTAYSQTLSATGDTPIAWSIDSGNLPDGLSLSGNTISGTPGAVGTFSFTVKATNAAGSDTQDFSIAIGSATPPGTAPSITTESMPNGTVGTAYSQTLSATGDTPIAWTIDSGGLPDGLSLSGNTISGTPGAVGTFSFTVKATNAAGSDTQDFSIAISSATPPGTAPGITTESMPNGTVGTAYSQILSATGDTPIIWSIDSGNLPDGLSLSGNTISGTPGTAGTFGFTVKAENAEGSDTKALEIVIGSTPPVGTAPTITTTSLPGGMVGTAYSQTLSATGDTPITWSLAGGGLPTGLTLTGNTISGTPAAEGTFSFIVKAINAAGSDTQNFSIVISPATPPGTAPSITTESMPNGTVGTAYSQSLSATGDSPIIWSIDSGNLPTGLTLAGNTISGTPAAEGTFSFIVKAINAAGSDTQNFSIVISSATPPTYTATNAVTDVTSSGARVSGNVTSDGGAAVTERGFVYGRTANPAIGDADVTQVASGSGTGTFTANISGLAANTTYHVRAYAINSEGTSYGADVPFTTLTGGGAMDDPYIFRTLTDSATGVAISGTIHRDAALTVGNIVFGNNAACDAIRQRINDDNFITLFDRDISLSRGFTGTLTITIPVGNAYDGETVTVLHCANGTLKTYAATVRGGKATFIVAGLSPIALFIKSGASAKVPNTGDGGFSPWLGLTAAGALLSSLSFVLRRRLKR